MDRTGSLEYSFSVTEVYVGKRLAGDCFATRTNKLRTLRVNPTRS